MSADYEQVHVLMPERKSYEVAINSHGEMWFTEQDIAEAVQRMRVWAESDAPYSAELHRIPDGDWANLARTALGLEPR